MKRGKKLTEPQHKLLAYMAKHQHPVRDGMVKLVCERLLRAGMLKVVRRSGEEIEYEITGAGREALKSPPAEGAR